MDQTLRQICVKYTLQKRAHPNKCRTNFAVYLTPNENLFFYIINKDKTYLSKHFVKYEFRLDLPESK